jgi:hypothetical protein
MHFYAVQCRAGGWCGNFNSKSYIAAVHSTYFFTLLHESLNSTVVYQGATTFCVNSFPTGMVLLAQL